MRKLLTLTAAAALVLVVGFAGTAQAQLTKFTDETAFVDASGAVMIGIPDSDTGFPSSSCGAADTGFGTSLTITFDSNDLTVTQEPSTSGLCIFDPAFTPSLSNTNPNDSTVPLLVANGEDDYKIVFDIPVAAIGFLLLTNSSSAEIVTLKDSGGAVIDSAQDISADTPNNGRQFIGFISTVPIKTVIFDTTGGASQNEGFEGFKAATFPPLSKELTSGPDEDSDGEIDVVVPTLTFPDNVLDPYDFTITYVPEDDTDVLIVDAVPAEWQVEMIEGVGPNDQKCFVDIPDGEGGLADAGPGNDKCNREKSATIIEWTPVPTVALSDLNVVVDTRRSPSGKNKFKPTACGPLFLNDGAIVLELPLPTVGDPVVVAGPSNSLCLAAVDNPGTGTGDRSATADHDTDTLASFAEACTNVPRSDPCLPDTDGDGVNDNVDNCPLISSTRQLSRTPVVVHSASGFFLRDC